MKKLLIYTPTKISLNWRIGGCEAVVIRSLTLGRAASHLKTNYVKQFNGGKDSTQISTQY